MPRRIPRSMWPASIRAHKLTILVNLALSARRSISRDLYTEGITHHDTGSISPMRRSLGTPSSCWASRRSSRATLKRASIPPWCRPTSPMAKVEGVYNAIQLVGDAVGDVVLYGRGAGIWPTGSAVVSDIIAIARNLLKGASGSSAAGVISAGSTASAAHAADGRNHARCIIFRFMVTGSPGSVVADRRGTWDAAESVFRPVLQKGRRKGRPSRRHQDPYGERARCSNGASARSIACPLSPSRPP